MSKNSVTDESRPRDESRPSVNSTAAVDLKAVASGLSELWSPKIVGEVDNSFVKVAKIKGEFVWHAHDQEDELFFVLDGLMNIELEDRTVEVSAGQTFVVPKGVRHKPVAENECLIMLIEQKSTLHTGKEVVSLTRSIDDQLGC